MTTWNFVETALWHAVPGNGTSGYLNYDFGQALPLPAYAADAITLSDTGAFDSPSYTVHLPADAIAFSPLLSGHLTISFNFTEPLSGSVDLLSQYDALVMQTVDNIVTLGFAASDGELLGCQNSQCLFSGHWEAVTHAPEPGFVGVALIAATLVAATLGRLRKSPLNS